MIDYTLAKSLKDAGFPQRYQSPGEYFQNGQIREYEQDQREDYNWERDTSIHIPTLSELIEACKKITYGVTLQDTVSKWLAFVYGTSKYGEHGSTPEEAVARLWLALNKKP